MLPRHEPVSLTQSELTVFLEAAEQAADAAAQVTCAYFRSDMAVSNKAGDDGFDPVTQADRKAELAIRESLQARFPDIGFLGEEHAAIEGSSGLLWVVDPIDGTRAFMSGMPLWGTLIALYNGEDAILGVIDQPFLGERYSGVSTTARLRDKTGTRPLTTRRVDGLSQATLYCTTPDMFVENNSQQRFQAVKDTVQLTRYGGDCYAYALLASGYVDIVLDCDLKPYDIQAIIPIVRAAGGIVTDWQGRSAVDGGYVVATAGEHIHDQVLALLQG